MKKITYLFLAVLFLFGIIAATISRSPKPETAPKSLIYAEQVPAQYRAAFIAEVIAVGDRLDIKPDWLMIVMKFETGSSFRANIRNRYSGATGLIQFIPTTARHLGTTTKKLAAMSSVEQLTYVEKYFKPYTGRIQDAYDCYLVVFAPAFLGKPNSQVLYRADGKTLLDKRRYYYNRGLDTNKDGVITIRDVKRQIRRFVPNSELH